MTAPVADLARAVLTGDTLTRSLDYASVAVFALTGALAEAPRSSAVMLVATGPAMGITSNQRSAYLRVLSVRNVLLQLGFDKDQLQMRIETAVEAPAPTVNIAVGGQP